MQIEIQDCLTLLPGVHPVFLTRHCRHLGQDISVLWACPACCRLLSSIPGLYSLDASSILPPLHILGQPGMSPDAALCPLWGQNRPQLRTTGSDY